MITGRCSWVPALRPRARASAGTTGSLSLGAIQIPATKLAESARYTQNANRDKQDGPPKTVSEYRRPLFSIDLNNGDTREKPLRMHHAKRPRGGAYYLGASLSPARSMPT
jgi:hypothetical protein